MRGKLLGGIEAGGTKFVCGKGTGPEDLVTAQFPTTTPTDVIAQAVEFFRQGDQVEAIGIGSFGPVDLRMSSATFGFIMGTPKPGWPNINLAGAIRDALQVPVGFDTDVNAAALGEARWGAAQGLSDFLYLTVGTGIGGGAMVHGRILHGLVHTEMGHIHVPHDRTRDPFEGVCTYHKNCLEGLASGPSMEARWGVPARNLPADHPAWVLEADYLAYALATWVCTLSPQRILLGGGVAQQPHLFPLVRTSLLRILNGYVQAPEILDVCHEYVVAPGLGIVPEYWVRWFSRNRLCNTTYTWKP